MLFPILDMVKNIDPTHPTAMNTSWGTLTSFPFVIQIIRRLITRLLYVAVIWRCFFDGCGTESRAEPLNFGPCQRMG